MAQSIRKVGIVGAGQMGTGIAHVCSLAGIPVVINDVAAPRLKDALATINGNMSRQVSRKRITEEQKQAGLKLISSRWFEIPAFVSIGIIIACIAAAVWPSVRALRREARQLRADPHGAT